MTPDEIAIRNMRGCGVPWAVIAKDRGKTVAECRKAIGMPEYQQAERQQKPWDIQRGLFDDQPDRSEISDK